MGQSVAQREQERNEEMWREFPDAPAPNIDACRDERSDQARNRSSRLVGADDQPTSGEQG